MYVHMVWFSSHTDTLSRVLHPTMMFTTRTWYKYHTLQSYCFPNILVPTRSFSHFPCSFFPSTCTVYYDLLSFISYSYHILFIPPLSTLLILFFSLGVLTTQTYSPPPIRLSTGPFPHLPCSCFPFTSTSYYGRTSSLSSHIHNISLSYLVL